MASGPLARWADDIEQEARVALWQAIQSYDRSKNDGVDCYVRWKTVMLLRNALDRYGRWESREFPTDELIDISFCPKQNERFI
jgi:DNA-directed RNA polymerase specialized sigma subunit